MTQVKAKQTQSWRLWAMLNCAFWGIVASIIAPSIPADNYKSAFIIACSLIAFAPIPFALWIDARNRGQALPKSQFVTVIGLTVVLIVVIVLAVITGNN
jgi:hypothetical protein